MTSYFTWYKINYYLQCVQNLGCVTYKHTHMVNSQILMVGQDQVKYECNNTNCHEIVATLLKCAWPFYLCFQMFYSFSSIIWWSWQVSMQKLLMDYLIINRTTLISVRFPQALTSRKNSHMRISWCSRLYGFCNQKLCLCAFITSF